MNREEMQCEIINRVKEMDDKELDALYTVFCLNDREDFIALAEGLI